ncbi:hypothetical protein IU500_07150 [Nocardia terpenica]|uniref:hypothetical protein n=1 Tax=Nocardia terpenica TaxID=455432 RepID=UPI001894FBD1|nr:hypothetical protein [Nocardia terpenica]MBF6060554.1 hypothetical protein [Nocardia terpenica]MBF6103814.1 hypothetical protein [Nocardia terpenica]MBF6111812.1 hypothetical protein [Nocardia terpenica]MBF6118035.1 hypothetical protein [Nocardia terpenica]MBF6155239.1 hypothetical protein [Nocardia terpenica]
MSNTGSRSGSRLDVLAERYAAEIAYLRTNYAAEPTVTTTGGGCTALQARLGRLRMLATNGDHCLIGPEQDEEYEGVPVEWLVALYGRDDATGDDRVAQGEAADFEAAVAAAVASYECGDFVPE